MTIRDSLRRAGLNGARCFVLLLAACGGSTGSGGSGPGTAVSSDAGSVRIAFAEDMDVTTIDATTVQLVRDDQQLPAVVQGAVRLALLIPASALLPDIDYTVVLGDGLRTAAGRAYGGQRRISFRLRPIDPDAGPALVATIPVADTEVEPTAIVAMVFDRPLQPDSVTDASVFVRPAGGAPLPATRVLSADGGTVTLRTAAVIAGGAHELVATTALRGANGKALAADRVVPFRVRAGFFVVSSDPDAGSRVGPGLDTVTIRCNRPVHPPSVNAGNFVVARNGVQLAGRYVANGETVSFVAANRIEQDGQYDVQIRDLLDTGLIPLSRPHAFSFTVDGGLTGWKPVQEIAVQGLDPRQGALASTSSGRDALVWLERDRAGPQRNAFISLRRNGIWSAPMALEDVLDDVIDIKVASNDAGDTLALWRTLVNREIRTYVRLHRSGAWQAEQLVAGFLSVDWLHVDAAGNAGVLGLGTDGFRVVESINGAWLPARTLLQTQAAIAYAHGPDVWSTDDAGRLVVYATAQVQNRYPMLAILFEPGSGWAAPREIFDGNLQRIEFEYVTPGGDAVVVFRGQPRGGSGSLFVQCMRSGQWLGQAQDMGSEPSTQRVYAAGDSGDVLLLGARVDGNRTRAYARLFRLANGGFDAGQFIDDTSVTATGNLQLWGSPDVEALAVYQRVLSTGSQWAANVFSQGTWGPMQAYTGYTDGNRSLFARLRGGGALLLRGNEARRYVVGEGFRDARTNPHGAMEYVVGCQGRIHGVGERVENQAGGQQWFIRFTAFE